MAILALATSGKGGEVGLALPDGTLCVRELGLGAARGRGLLPAVAGLLDASGLRPAEIERIVVDVGPGSFTGVRVGVTTAKALALALDIPVTQVTSLAAFARAAPAERDVLAIRDAGRGTLYHARYGPQCDGRRPELEAPARSPAADVLSAPATTLVVGEEAEALLSRHAEDRPPGRAAGKALDVFVGAAVLLAEAASGSGVEAPSPHAVVPLYLQASTPEERLAALRRKAPSGSQGNDRS